MSQDKKYLSFHHKNYHLILMMIILNCFITTAYGGSKSTIYDDKGKEIKDTNESDDSQQQNFYLSEQEFKLIDLDDISLDYSFKQYTSNCDPKYVDIKNSSDAKFINYIENSINSPVRNIIIYANQKTLKVNAIGLLSNNNLISFIDDASSIDTAEKKDSTHLKNIKLYPIPNQDKCSNLKKAGSDSFIFECVKKDPTTQQSVITLFQYKSDNFSNESGIDLTNVQPEQSILDFDPKFAFHSKDSIKNNKGEKVTEEDQYQIYLNEYEHCTKDTGFYFNKDTNVYHYFRVCKYHETFMSDKGSQLQYTEDITSFFEFYDLSLKQDGIVKGTSPKVFFPSDPKTRIKTQGVQQVIDDSIIVMDYDNGLLFFEYDTISGGYKNQEFFIKYFYDQKYFNLFIQRNQDIEFTIQDSIPNYLVVNTQMYLIMYQLNSTAELGLNTFPRTVSISHFVQSVQNIHRKNKQDDMKEHSDTVKSFQVPDIRNVNSFRSIRYNFDQYLYYIEIKFSDQDNYSYFLLINRALTDYTTSMKMNSTAIEMDYLTKSPYSKVFHYPIPGLFYSNIRTRVRLFEIGNNDDDDTKTPDQKYKNFFRSNTPTDTPAQKLSITTYSWKSAQVLKLYTKQFDKISQCRITIDFDAKKDSFAVGSKTIQAQVNLIPRSFSGVISKQGSSISKKFFNPKPVFEIKDWFFGPGINFAYQTQGHNNDVTMQIKYNSTTNIDSGVKIQLQGTKENEVSVYGSNFGNCKVKLCDEKLIAAIQVGNDYYIFFQNCLCLFWFEKCTLNSTLQAGSASLCKKSLDVNLSQTIDKILFDGTNILATSYQSTSLKDRDIQVQTPQLVYMKVTEQDVQITKQQQQNSSSSSSSSSNTFNKVFSNEKADQCESPQLKSLNKISERIQSKIFIKKNQQQKEKFLKQELKTSSTNRTYVLSQPQKLDVKIQLEKVQILSIFCIPNTNKYGVIAQSKLLSIKSMSIFSINKDIQDLTLYEFQDKDQIQDSYDVSLLDQGIIFASRNTVGEVLGKITIYKVNFLTKKINVDSYFTQANMISQIMTIQNKAFGTQEVRDKNKDSSQNYQDNLKQKKEQMKAKNIVFINDINNFMNNFSVKVWRNDDSQTYRFLLIDYDNNCLFDYLLYDLIKPIFVRQVNLYDYQITASQQFQITNNMISLHVNKNNQAYLISLEINGESINQIKKIEIQDDKQVRSFSQVQQSLGTPYVEGSMCGVFSLPTPTINCIFNPSILLNFDFSNTASAGKQTLKENGSSASDKQVDFQIQLFTDLNIDKNEIILHTDFSNFDTSLIQNSTNPISYDVKTSQVQNDNDDNTKMANIYLDTSFVQGSIEDYYIKSPNPEKVKIQGYIDTHSAQTKASIPKIKNYKAIDRNPYQLVNLLDDSLIVINQNMKFEFKEIFRINYSDITIKKPFQTKNGGNLQGKKKHIPENIKLCKCSDIYSNQILNSQTTTTYLYILLCNTDSTNQVYITFNVDVNHYSSLLDQGKDWEKTMQNNVRYVDIEFLEEELDSMISQIRNIQILSLTDDMNNIQGFIFMMVRLLTDSTNPNAQADNTIYILWADNEPTGALLSMQEIEQINSADFSLNYISVQNFVASFPQQYPNQTTLDLNERRNFVFNIGWDDGQRYVVLALLKLTLPPDMSDSAKVGNQKLVFNAQYEDIYSDLFSSFIKSDQTYLYPFTRLKSTITFLTDSYNSSVIITNEFSIIEFTSIQSPDPFIGQSNKNTPLPQLLPQQQEFNQISDTNNISQLITYSQYAWCNNNFYVNNVQQQILKYKNYLIIMCMQPLGDSKQQSKPSLKSILKVYKINQNSSDDDSSTSNNNDNQTLGQGEQQKQKMKLLNNQTVSMVQSINYNVDPSQSLQISVASMSFRQDNQALFFDLILYSSDRFEFQLLQYPVNKNPILMVSPDIKDETKVNVCTKNKYPQEVCSEAVFINPFIDISDQSKKQWMKFAGLIALPLFISLSIIFISFIFMKKLRKNRQDEFVELLKNQSMAQYKSKSDISFIEPMNIESRNDKFNTSIQPQDKDPNFSVSEHALFTFNDNHLNASTELR